MAETLTLQLPDEIGRQLNRTPGELLRDVRLYAGLMMFQLGKLSSGAAAQVAGIPRVMFLDLCAEYAIEVSQLAPADLREELAGE